MTSLQFIKFGQISLQDHDLDRKKFHSYLWITLNLFRYFIDQESFFKLDFRVQKFLWVFCCVNNCVNPFLYNMFAYNSSAHCRSVSMFYPTSSTPFIFLAKQKLKCHSPKGSVFTYTIYVYFLIIYKMGSDLHKSTKNVVFL